MPPTLEGTAGEVMASRFVSVNPDTPLTEVIRILMENKIKRIVVADKQGRLLGMVDRDVILNELATQ